MYPHRIRLRGPWDVDPKESPAAAVPSIKAINPRELGAQPFAGPLRLVRRFGVPRQLDDYETVWLCVDGTRVCGTFSLNGRQLGSFPGGGDREFAVTTLLQTRNELKADLDVDRPLAGFWDEVALEIRGEYFLRGVAVSGDRIVTGTVVGRTTGGLELYVLAHGRSAAYQRVAAGPDGVPFTLTVPVTDASGPCNPHYPAWRVELVEGANRWFTVDVEPPAAAVR